MKNSLENARLEINRIDRDMARLFEERMGLAEVIAKYKKENGLPVFDPARETELIERNSGFIENEALRRDYVKFLSGVMSVSKDYQRRIISDQDNVIPVILGDRSYNVHIGRNLLSNAAKAFGIVGRRAFIITDSGVPEEYARSVSSGFDNAFVYTVEQGEGAKSLEVFGSVCEKMLELGFARGDVIVAVGGGVVGDLAGFVAASYMRGVDFYNIPTTLLSMVDSSIGGKTAVNHKGVKNIIGAFYQPKGVLIDTDTLATLPKRHISNGLAESIKMAATSDGELFSLLENADDLNEILAQVISGSIKIKRDIVEADEREGGIRKLLNFGHTFGHAVEAATEMNELYHGECVAIGMMVMCEGEVKERLGRVLVKYGLPIEYCGDTDDALKFILSDKKKTGDSIDTVFLPKIGRGEIRRSGIEELSKMIKASFGGKI